MHLFQAAQIAVKRLSCFELRWENPFEWVNLPSPKLYLSSARMLMMLALDKVSRSLHFAA